MFLRIPSLSLEGAAGSSSVILSAPTSPCCSVCEPGLRSKRLEIGSLYSSLVALMSLKIRLALLEEANKLS